MLFSVSAYNHTQADFERMKSVSPAIVNPDPCGGTGGTGDDDADASADVGTGELARGVDVPWWAELHE